MTSAVLSVIAFLALFAWRFVFAGLRRGPMAREIAPPHRQQTNILEQSLDMLQLAGVAVIPDNPAENGSNSAKPTTPKNCTKKYLRHIMALTGATPMGNCHSLELRPTTVTVTHYN